MAGGSQCELAFFIVLYFAAMNASQINNLLHGITRERFLRVWSRNTLEINASWRIFFRAETQRVLQAVLLN